MFKKIYLALIGILLPVVSYAQLTETRNLLESIEDIVREILIPLAFALALLFFFWGVAKYIWSEGKGKAEGKSIMIWGVVALAVMTTIWGLIAFLAGEVGLDEENTVVIPTIQKNP